MRDLLLRAIVKLLGQLVTPEMLKGLKDELIAYLRELAKKTENKLDDALIDILADALEVN
jgi:hypothetical protein